MQEWELVKQEDVIGKEHSNSFALCIDGIVQMTITVDDFLASLYDLKPEIVRCSPFARPGMTIDQAQV